MTEANQGGKTEQVAWDMLKENKPELDVQFLDKLQEMFNLYRKKNSDYGADNIFIGGTDGVVLRMGDKINRLWQMVIMKKPMQYRWESVRDTLIDLAVYCVFGLISQDNPQFKPVLSDKVTVASYIRKLPKEEKEEVIRALLMEE